MKIDASNFRMLIELNYARKSFIPKVIIGVGTFSALLSFFSLFTISSGLEVRVLLLFSVSITFMTWFMHYKWLQLNRKIQLRILNKEIEIAGDTMIEIKEFQKYLLAFDDDFFPLAEKTSS